MIYPSVNLIATFEAVTEQFQVAKDLNCKRVFALSMQTHTGGQLALGEFCPISEAISAVSQQRTGYSKWHRRSLTDLPRQVHESARWYFGQKLGTMPREACS